MKKILDDFEKKDQLTDIILLGKNGNIQRIQLSKVEATYAA
jgi:hypothetical protein